MADRPPFRAEHVGSLPRPAALMEARAACDAGKIGRDALREIEDRTIRDIVHLQERVGIGVVTDGEHRRRGWREFVYDRCDGFGPERVARKFSVRRFDGTVLEPSPEPKITGKLRRREPLAAAEYATLKTMTTRPIKANLPTWSFVNFYAGEAAYDHQVYPDHHAAMADAAALLREEIADLGRHGCTYLQFDEVPLALLCDPRNQAVLRARGDDPETAIDFYIDGINAALRGRPATMAVCVHLCRGNSGHGMGDGGYEPIAERLFNRLDVDGFFLEYDTPRAGDFGPLRFLPAPKRAVLGLMSTKLGDLEPVDALRRRIDEAAKIVPLDRLCLSPQCGFASVPGRSRSFDMDLVERKLARVVETAHAVWG